MAFINESLFFMVKRIFITLSFLLIFVAYGKYAKKVISKNLAKSENESVLKSIPKAEFFHFEDKKKFVIKDKTKSPLVHFWATWCGPCEEELPSIIKYVVKNKGKMHLYLIAVNDKPVEIKKFLRKFKIYSEVFTILTDDSDIHKNKYGTYKLPETYLFNTDHSLVKKFVGPQEWSTSYYQKFVQFID